MNNLWAKLANDWPLRALALASAIVLYFAIGLIGLEERYITVPLRIDLSENLVAGEEYPQFVRVYFRGTREDIFSISENEVLVSADFTRYTSEGQYRAVLRHQLLGSAENIDPLELRLDPGELVLRLEDKEIVRVNVIPIIATEPASGYELTSYSLLPPAVRISGPQSIVEGFQEILSESIDLSSHSTSFTSRVSLQQPHPLIEFEDGSFIEFRAEINESIFVSTFDNIAISVAGLPQNLSVEVQGIRGSIRAQTSQSLIDRLSPESIGLLIDASGIAEAGQYTVPVRPIIPRGFVVFSFEPSELLIDVFEN